MREQRIDLGGVKAAVYDWGPADAAQTVVCAHGLTRNGRDFDRLAAALAAAGRRVIAFDVAGRGLSDWLEDPTAYAYPTYIEHAFKLLAALGLKQVDWVGTSMGGLMGMMVDAAGIGAIRRLVLNDIGSFIPKEALKTIVSAHVHRNGAYPSRAAAEADLRRAYGGYGPMDEAWWAHLFSHSLHNLPSGECGVVYDPAIFTSLTSAEITDIDLSPVWAAVTAPTLILRGAQSGVLLAETAQQMATRAGVSVLEIADCGHAPSLSQPTQIQPIVDFLTAA